MPSSVTTTPTMTTATMQSLDMDMEVPSTPSVDGESDTSNTPPSVHRNHSAAGSDEQDAEKAAAILPSPPRAFYKDVEDGRICPPFMQNPPARTREPFRDFSGPFTVYRLLVLIWMGGCMTALYFLMELVQPGDPDRSPYRNSWISNPFIGIIWLIPLPASVLAFVGAIWYRFDTKLDEVQPISYNVVFRIVSRGLNQECLVESIRHLQAEMRANSYFPYLIEVVTDADSFEAPPDVDVLHLRVPGDYVTPNGTLFKARALHFACEHSVVPGDSWLVHLDEETRPVPSGIKGIAKMIAESERTGDLKRVGQGTILYHRAFSEHKFLTLADMRRTGDDFGHFHLQHRIGHTIFGFHGAFIVCRQDAEAALGFDIGPAGSITEDAWWILIAMRHGYRTKWVEGYMEEQSTQSILDFLKQRRRWMFGLIKVILYSPASWPYRLVAGWFIFTWMFVPVFLPLQIGYTVALYMFDLQIPQFYRFCVIFILSIQIYIYLVGWIANARESPALPVWQVPFWTLLLLLLTPVFQVLELTALVMAFFAGCTTNGKGFHVVQKDATKKNEDAAAVSSS